MKLIDIIDSMSNNQIQVKFVKQFVTFQKRKNNVSTNERSFKFIHINYVIKGKIEGYINNKHIKITNNGILIINSDIPHTLTWHKDTVYYSFSFYLYDKNGEIIKLSEDYFGGYPNNEMGNICRMLGYAIEFDSSSLKNIKAKNLLLFILVEIYERCKQQNISLESYLKQHLYEYCAERDFTHIDLSILAQKAGYNPDYFSRLFKKSCGITLKKWISREKLLYAARLLISEELSIQEIANRLNYCDQYVFSREFKKVLGESPKQYREKYI